PCLLFIEVAGLAVLVCILIVFDWIAHLLNRRVYVWDERSTNTTALSEYRGTRRSGRRGRRWPDTDGCTGVHVPRPRGWTGTMALSSFGPTTGPSPTRNSRQAALKSAECRLLLPGPGDCARAAADPRRVVDSHRDEPGASPAQVSPRRAVDQAPRAELELPRVS